ncbi:hypothetical protein [Nocardioides sp. KR10-350]|uniref:hypothetical protein n=1 Tax=Nocardioides cheoyonin TaxID=3156615 RepID=UPI0032B49709
MTDGLLDGVHKWIESSGRALELRVARTFRHEGASAVVTSFTYADPVTGLDREGDVLARYQWEGTHRRAELACIVECKSSTDHPWVGFFDRRAERNLVIDSWVAYAFSGLSNFPKRLAALWISEPPFNDYRVATHIAAAHAKDSRNPANDAVRQVMSAVLARKKEHVKQHHSDPTGLVLVPLIVTAAPLVSCELGRDGEIHLEEVKSLGVWGWMEGRAKRVYVVNESEVEGFARGLHYLADTASRDPEI